VKFSGISRTVSYRRVPIVSFASLTVLSEESKAISVSIKRAESSYTRQKGYLPVNQSPCVVSVAAYVHVWIWWIP